LSITARIDRIRVGITNSYLIRADGAILIDPGEPRRGRAVLRKLSRLIENPGEIGLLLATHGHYDHIGASDTLRRTTGAQLAIHREDAGWARSGGFVPLIPTTRWSRLMLAALGPLSIRAQRACPVDADLVFDDGGLPMQDYGIPAQIVPTPGHTPGSISVLLDSGEALVGDLAVNGPPMTFKPSLSIIAADPQQMRRSWHRLVELGARTVYPAHGKPFPVEAIPA
jgi:glyoxylase-like metal-dependent hydrolase (beta-lactamase superfamily II)